MGPTAAELGQQLKSFWSGASQKVAGLANGRAGATSPGAGAGGTSPTGQPGQPDFRQQFMEVAETGKRGFNTLLSKAKAKMQEYNANQQGGGQPNSGTGEQGYSPASYQPPMQQQHYMNQTPGYYAPAPAARRTPSPASVATPQETGYRVNPPNNTGAARMTPTPVDVSAPVQSLGAGMGVAPPMPTRSSFDTPDGSRASFDTSRLGLKPKRPVSLINNNMTPQSPTAAAKGKSRATTVEDAAEEDDLEYITSPFEDRR